MIQLGPASLAPTGGAYGLGVWRGLPFASADPIERYVTSRWNAWEQFRRDLGWGRHKGIDLHAAIGTPLFAIGPGEVEVAGTSALRPAGGIYVQIHHGDGLRSYYLHMSEVDVAVGDQVSRGQFIGKSGNTAGGMSIAPHLHFEIDLDDVGSPLSGARVPQDPALWITEHPVEIESPERELGDVRLAPVEALIVAIDGTVPSWDQILKVRYRAHRNEDGSEVHEFVLDPGERERVQTLSDSVEWD